VSLPELQLPVLGIAAETFRAAGFVSSSWIVGRSHDAPRHN
jgi:hypothetical protein